MTHESSLLSSLKPVDRAAAEKLLPRVYDQLRRLAAARLSREAPGQSLQATDLVHEAYLRLVGRDPAQPFDGEAHFFAAAAESMRRILIDRARRRRRLKHGGARRRVPLNLDALRVDEPSDDLLALDEALTAFAREDPDAAALVQLRVFAGLTHSQAAGILGISRRTADRDWAYARAWLCEALSDSRAPKEDEKKRDHFGAHDSRSAH
jgi:RNA polymerase sigma factor (TIGR02999 family)